MKAKIILALALLASGIPSASAQERDPEQDANLEEIARLFGAKGRAVAKVEALGGKIEYEEGDPHKAVIGVDLTGSKVADSDLAFVKYLPQLQTLDLSNTKVSDAGLARLGESSGFYKLRIAGASISEAGASRLREKGGTSLIYRRPRALRYFDDWALDPLKIDHLTDLTSEYLFAMGEPSLLAKAREDRKAVVYRFVLITNYGGPFAIRVTPAEGGATLLAVQLDGKPGFGGGKPLVRRTITLSRDQWDEVNRRLNDVDFWSMPTKLWKPGIADGAALIMEGVKDGKHRAVFAQFPDPAPSEVYRNYVSLCDTMLRLAGPDIKTWWKGQ